MFGFIKKYLDMIDRDVEDRMRQDLLQKGFTQNEVDKLLRDTKEEKNNKPDRKLTPEERLNQRMKNSRF